MRSLHNPPDHVHGSHLEHTRRTPLWCKRKKTFLNLVGYFPLSHPFVDPVLSDFFDEYEVYPAVGRLLLAEKVLHGSAVVSACLQEEPGVSRPETASLAE